MTRKVSFSVPPPFRLFFVPFVFFVDPFYL